MVRWATPVIWMRRTLASDYTLSGFDLKAGDRVLMFYNSANRDEDAFETPTSLTSVARRTTTTASARRVPTSAWARTSPVVRSP
jgi:cytochrome P450